MNIHILASLFDWTDKVYQFLVNNLILYFFRFYVYSIIYKTINILNFASRKYTKSIASTNRRINKAAEAAAPDLAAPALCAAEISAFYSCIEK